MKNKIQPIRPKRFNPSIDEVKSAMDEVSKLFGTDKVIGSTNYPELKVCGKRK